MLFSFHSRKIQPLAALSDTCWGRRHGQRRQRRLRHRLPPSNRSSLNCLQLTLSPKCLVSQTVGVCLIVWSCRHSTCLDYVTIPVQSPAYVTRQENASTDSNYRVWHQPSSPPARPASKMQKSLQMHVCLKFNHTVLRETDFTTWRNAVSLLCTLKFTDLTTVVTMWHRHDFRKMCCVGS